MRKYKLLSPTVLLICIFVQPCLGNDAPFKIVVATDGYSHTCVIKYNEQTGQAWTVENDLKAIKIAENGPTQLPNSTYIVTAKFEGPDSLVVLRLDTKAGRLWIRRKSAALVGDGTGTWIEIKDATDASKSLGGTLGDN